MAGGESTSSSRGMYSSRVGAICLKILTVFHADNNASLEQKTTPDSYIILVRPFCITEGSEERKTTKIDLDE